MSGSAVYDLVVAGSGPAGLAAAIHASRAGLTVLVVDPHDGVIDKACGEGIMPGGVEALERLGIRPEGRPFIGIRWSDAVDDQLDAFGHFPRGTGLGVRRVVLSAALLERARMCGVRFRTGRVSAFEQRDGSVILEDGTCAQWLIGADGLRSQVRRALGVERPPRRVARLGLRRHYALSPWSAHVEVFLGDGAEAYVTPVADDLVGVAILFDEGRKLAPDAPARASTAGAPARFDRLLQERFPLLAWRLGGATEATPVRGAGPFEQRVKRRVVGNVLLVGDAAGYLDPLTGEGIALGLATAEAAIDTLRSGTADDYEARYEAISSRYFLLTGLLLRTMRRRALHRPLLRAARAWPAAFDATLGMLAHLDPRGRDAELAVGPLLPEAPIV